MTSANKHRAPAKEQRAQRRRTEKRLEYEGSNYRKQYVTKGSMEHGEEGEKGEQKCMIQDSVILVEFILISGLFGFSLNFLYFLY